MKFAGKEINLQDGITKEWIITNGIGGFASSTIVGCNTRKYHGLLIAPLTPPARRFLILSKIDESITFKGEEYNLYTNMNRNYISEGHKYLQSFEKEYFPIFTYKVKDTSITKIICMKHMENTVCIMYRIKNGNHPSTLRFSPIVNYRDFHQMNTNHNFDVKQEIRNNKVKVIVDKHADKPIYINCDAGRYIDYENNFYKNMYYVEEEKRGFYPEEDHVVTGTYEIELRPNQEKEISIVCSLEENIDEIDIKDVINKEIIRINELVLDSGFINIKKQKETEEYKKLIRDYIIATDNFIVYRPSFALHTLIAGYPWFLDWGRDALISFEGTLLLPHRYNIAKEVLLTFTKNVKFGLVPNGYSGFDNRPLYNSVDASLLLFEQVIKYLKYTNDYKFVKEKIYPLLLNIIASYESGIDIDDNNIYVDKDGLLVSGTPNTQNTWMDAKYGDYAVTPRNGKAVEINALWYNALKITEELVKEFEGKEQASGYAKYAAKCKKSFNEKFYNKQKKCLYDVVGNKENDKKVRPNQLFSLSLTYQVVDPASQQAVEIINTTTKKLLNKYGLKTLAKGEENYVEVYEGDSAKRDMSYHQGITWPWLLGIYNDALKHVIAGQKDKEKKKELQEQYIKFKESVTVTFEKALNEDGMIGSISELYDSKAPYLPKGALAQNWSVAEVFRIILSK